MNLPASTRLEWFELTAAASAFTPQILFALAAEPALDRRELADVYAAYFPWIGLAIAMLDSYVDQPEDVTAEVTAISLTTPTRPSH